VEMTVCGKRVCLRDVERARDRSAEMSMTAKKDASLMVGDLYSLLENALDQEAKDDYRPNETVLTLPTKTTLFHGTIKTFDPKGMGPWRYYSTNMSPPCGLIYGRNDRKRHRSTAWVHEFETLRPLELLCVARKTHNEYAEEAVNGFDARHHGRRAPIDGVVRPL